MLWEDDHGSPELACDRIPQEDNRNRGAEPVRMRRLAQAIPVGASAASFILVLTAAEARFKELPRATA